MGRPDTYEHCLYMAETGLPSAQGLADLPPKGGADFAHEYGSLSGQIDQIFAALCIKRTKVAEQPQPQAGWVND